MGVWREGTAWCLCSGGGRSERLKGSIFVTKGPALAAISAAGGGGGGTGLLIHRNLLLTTHANLPSVAAAEAAEIRLNHGRLPAKLVPQRFFVTSPVLDLTIVGLDVVDTDTTSQMQQAQYLKTCCNPSLDLGRAVYLLGYTDKKDLMIAEGKVVIATDNLIKLSTDGVTWCSGSAGFDVQGNLAFMVCDPMKLASSPTARSTASSSSSLSWKKDTTTQFGIPIPIICDWLHQHWEGNLDEVSKPRLPHIRLMSSGQRSENSGTSFTRRQIFKATEEEESDDLSSSSGQPPRCQPGSSVSGNAKVSHDESPVIDLRSSQDREQGIRTPEIFESPILTSGPVHMKEDAPVQLLDINFPPKAPTSIFLPLPLKKMLYSDNKAREPRPVNQSRLNGYVSQKPSQAEPVVYRKLPPVGTWQDDHDSEVQSSSSCLAVSEMRNDGDGFSCGEETMYSAETMESRNIPSPRESALKPVGRSQSCVSYNRWTSSPRNSATSKSSLHKQKSLIPVRKTNSQTSALPPKGYDYCSPTVSSSMKKRNNTEMPPKPRQNVVQVSPRWIHPQRTRRMS